MNIYMYIYAYIYLKRKIKEGAEIESELYDFADKISQL